MPLLSEISLKNRKIAVIGLGYVGLPLAVEFGKRRQVFGFDVSETRIAELIAGNDRTLEVEPDELRAADHLFFSCEPSEIADCSVFIVAVPTPIDKSKRPDLKLLMKACETVGKLLKVGDVVIFESTVYPGCTEEDCVPVLEKFSCLRFNKDFFCGYSPERINPGDKEHRLHSIVKVTSGSTPEIAKEIDNLYREIVTAGTHRAGSIRIAEAAKVIENTQRDLNIALMNEIFIFCKQKGLDFHQVMQLAGGKENFYPVTAGIVGGHCLPVDSYYLSSWAKPQSCKSVLEAAIAMNEMIKGELLNEIIGIAEGIATRNVVLVGLSYKEGLADMRNSGALWLAEELLARDFLVWGCDDFIEDVGLPLRRDFQEILASTDNVVIFISHHVQKFDMNLISKSQHRVIDPKNVLGSSFRES